MNKRFLAMLLAVAMLLTALPAVAFADAYQENWLKESHRNVYAGYNGNDFSRLAYARNPLNLYIDLEDPYSDFSYWHFVDSSKMGVYAEITFKDANGIPHTLTIDPTDDGQHYDLVTPSDWMLINGVSYTQSAATNINFVLSHSGRHIGTMGKVMATAAVAPWYKEFTLHEYFERDVDKYYERTVDEYYERTMDEYYERDVQDIYQRFAQRYLVPVFRKKVNHVNGTLVTRLTYSGTTAKAKPINGGAFKNGHTYVEVDVQQAMTEEGIWFRIADSSKNNGKKTPDQYNRPIDYYYHVSIRDGQLIVSFDNDLAYAYVGAYVVNKPKNFPANAPKHYYGSVTVDLPAGYDANGVIYLYTHIDGLGWYEKDGNNDYVYEFVKWMYNESLTEYGDYVFIETRYGEYELVNTTYGDWKLVRTEKGEYELVDTQKGAYELVDTQYGEWVLKDTAYGEYEWINTVYGAPVLVDTVYGEYEKVDEKTTDRTVNATYNGTLGLKVNGVDKPLNTAFYLPVGTYTFTVYDHDGAFDPVSKTVTIVRGDNGTVDFGTIEYRMADVWADPVRHEADREATEHVEDLEPTRYYADREATRHENDLDPVMHYADKEAVKHYADKEATRHETTLDPTTHYKNRETESVYIEEYIYLEDIKLGSETDPFGEHAIRWD